MEIRNLYPTALVDSSLVAAIPHTALLRRTSPNRRYQSGQSEIQVSRHLRTEMTILHHY